MEPDSGEVSDAGVVDSSAERTTNRRDLMVEGLAKMASLFMGVKTLLAAIIVAGMCESLKVNVKFRNVW